MAEVASAGQVRALGLVLQILAGVSLGTAIAPTVQAYVLYRGEGEVAKTLLHIIVPSIATVAVQLGAGVALSYGSRTAALVAALVHALVETAAVIWLAVALGLETGAVLSQVTRLAWPAVVVLAVVRDGGAAPRRGAEVGGPLTTAGVAALLLLPLLGYQLVAARDLPAGAGIVILAAPIVLGLLALRAGLRVVGGAPGRAVGVYAIAAAVIAAALFLLETLFGLAAEDLGTSAAVRIALSAITHAASLVAPLLIWAYARLTSGLARGAPEPAAAARPLAWLALWFGIEVAARVVVMASYLVRSTKLDRLGAPGDSQTRAILWVVTAVACALAAANIAAFFAARRGAPRRAMWAGLLGGVLATALLVLSWYAQDSVSAQAWGTLGWALANQAAVLLVLAWLHRPGARAQRGLADVFA